MTRYELMPTNGQKSFYGKAYVIIDNNGDETLYSYNTPVIRKSISGKLTRLWSGWSATTGKHINAFCGLGKADYMKLSNT